MLFEGLSLPVLELFRFGKGKDVEGHIEWFMQVLEKKLNQIPTADNSKFIWGFWSLYERVARILKGTQSRFEINYRSIFTFEEWLNNEKFNLPLRLNLFIDHHLTNPASLTDQQFAQQVALLFKLVKEKNILEASYRRSLVNRLIRNYIDYDLDREAIIL